MLSGMAGVTSFPPASASSLKTDPSPDLQLEIPAERIRAHTLSMNHTSALKKEGHKPRTTENAHSKWGTADDEVDSALETLHFTG